MSASVDRRRGNSGVCRRYKPADTTIITIAPVTTRSRFSTAYFPRAGGSARVSSISGTNTSTSAGPSHSSFEDGERRDDGEDGTDGDSAGASEISDLEVEISDFKVAVTA